MAHQQTSRLLRGTLYASAIVFVAAIAYLLYSRQAAAPPSTGALTRAPSPSSGLHGIPQPKLKSALEIGSEKTKLFIHNSYLFSTQSNQKNIDPSEKSSYRVGFGRETEQYSGSKLMGEVSFNVGDQQEESSSTKEIAQTHLSVAYLRPLNNNAEFRAGLSADLAPRSIWSTLELQLSMQLQGDLSLQLNHDYGTSLESSVSGYQTEFTLEKKF